MRRVRAGLIAVAVGAAALAPVAARANVITTFDVSGTATPTPPLTGTTFSGTLTVDVTSGTVTAIDVTFPGFSAFDMLSFSDRNDGSDWGVVADNSSGESLALDFTTTKTPGSLVGFTGGTIFSGVVFDAGGHNYYEDAGIITPSAVPEPSSLALMLAGIGALAFAVSPRRLG
jgi:PEP-CTERM motif